jgi:hypothetical protein
MLALEIATVGVALLTVFQSFVLIEAVKQVAQLRERLNLDDRPLLESLGLHAGQPVPESLLPALGAPYEQQDAVVLFLTSDCTTCRLIASELNDVVAALADEVRIVPIIQARRAEAIDEFLNQTGAPPQLFYRDADASVGSELEIQTRPLAVIAHDGRMTEAATVRNVHQLRTFAMRVLDHQVASAAPQGVAAPVSA